MTYLGNRTETRVSVERPEVQVKIGAERSGASDPRRDRVGARDLRKQYGVRDEPTPSAGTPRRPAAARLTPEARAKRDERERRRVENRRAHLRRTLIVGVAMVAVILLTIGAYHSSVLAVKRVVVEGNAYVSVDEVLRFAQVPTETTLPAVDTDAIEARLQGDPWIAAAEVRRSFPSTVRIVVTERSPVAILDNGTSFWYVDGTGLVLSESELATSSVLPVIRDVPSIEPTTGVVIASEELTNAITALAGISSELKDIVRIVKAPSVDETTLVTNTWVDIRVGDARDQIAEKSAIALRILAEKGDSVVFIDVRSVNTPISRGLEGE